MAEDTVDTADGKEIYKDALKLAWEDFELPPEEILMLEGLRERFDIDDEEHRKMELDVIETIIGMKEGMDIDQNLLASYYRKALEIYPGWEVGREKYTELMKELGKEVDLPPLPEEEEKEEPADEAAAPPPAPPEEEEEKEPPAQEGDGEKHSIKCPKCKGEIPVDKWEFPMKVKCPHCGAKGVLKKPPKS